MSSRGLQAWSSSEGCREFGGLGHADGVSGACGEPAPGPQRQRRGQDAPGQHPRDASPGARGAHRPLGAGDPKSAGAASRRSFRTPGPPRRPRSMLRASRRAKFPCHPLPRLPLGRDSARIRGAACGLPRTAAARSHRVALPTPNTSLDPRPQASPPGNLR